MIGAVAASAPTAATAGERTETGAQTKRRKATFTAATALPLRSVTRRANGRASRARWRQAARKLRGGEEAAEPGSDLGRHGRRNDAPTNRATQTGPHARQTRRREAGGHARQQRDGGDAGTGQTAPTRRARRQHRARIARNAHGDGGENGAFDGHDNRQNDGADIANGGRIGDQMSGDGDNGGARRRGGRAGATGQRARGTDGGSEERELGHNLTAGP